MPAKRKAQSAHAKAERHLARSHAGLREMIRRVGPCTLQPNPNHFQLLVRTIISQQLSTAVAKSIAQKLEQALAPHGPTPARISEAADDVIRGCGLSGAKLKSLRDLSAKVLDGSLPLAEIAERSDDEVKESLLKVHGIGPWSVDMFLMFSLGRPDVLPVGDLGLRVGMKELFGLTEMPPTKTLFELAEPWRPYRSIATWYFWRSKGPVPQS
jgi:DNA-3-methyladenine glycosylase II